MSIRRERQQRIREAFSTGAGARVRSRITLSAALSCLHTVHTLKSRCQSHSAFLPPSRQVHLLPRALTPLLPELLVAFILLFPLMPEGRNTFLRQRRKEYLIILISRGWTLLVSGLQGSCHILFCLPDSSFSEPGLRSHRHPRWMWGWNGPHLDRVATRQPLLWQAPTDSCYFTSLPLLLPLWICWLVHTFDFTSFPNLDFLTKASTPFNLKTQPLQPSLIAAKFKTVHPHHVTKGKWHKNVKTTLNQC